MNTRFLLLLLASCVLHAHVYAAIAPDPATALATSGRTTASASISWTPGTGSARIVVVRATGTTAVAPANGSIYTVPAPGSYNGPNATTGAGNVVVYNGSGTSVTITGLAANTVYVASVYEYAGGAGNSEYSTAASTSFSTLASEPAAHPAASAFTFNSVQSASSLKLEYPSAASIGAAGYLLLYKEGVWSAPDASDLPFDGIAYPAGSIIGAATVGAVSNSAQASSIVNGLTGTKRFSFFLIPFNGSATNTTYNYLTSGSTAVRTTPSFAGAVASAGGEAATISSLINEATISSITDGIQVWQFTITDGPDDDDLPTIVRSLTITTPANNQFDFSDGIRAAALFNGSIPVTATLSVPSASDQLQFTNIIGLSVPDDGTLTLSLRISVKSNVNNGASTGSSNKDGARFVFQVSNANIIADDASVSSQFTMFPAVTSQTTGANLYSVTATAIRFQQAPPASIDVFQALAPAPVVEAIDAGGNRDIDFALPVTLSVSGGPQLYGTATVVPVSGLASFSGMYFTTTGAGGLRATAGAWSTDLSTVVVGGEASVGVYTFNASATCSAAALTPTSLRSAFSFSPLTLSGINCNGRGNGAGAPTAATLLSTNASWGTALDMNRYIEFTVSPADGRAITLDTIVLEAIRTAAGATNFSLRGSLDGYAADLGTATVGQGLSVVNIVPGAAYSGRTTPVTFRIYPWGGGSTGDFRIDNLAIRGSAPVLLPVRLISLTGRRVSGRDQLEWRMASDEEGTLYVERSTNGRNFSVVDDRGITIGDIRYKYEGSSSPEQYWYRLRWRVRSGAISVSNALRLQGGEAGSRWSVSWQSNGLLARVWARAAGLARIDIMDMSGRRIASFEHILVPGFQTFRHALPAFRGPAFAQIFAPNENFPMLPMLIFSF